MQGVAMVAYKAHNLMVESSSLSPATLNFYYMEENKQTNLIHCIVGSNIRDIINQANKLELKREDVIKMFVLKEQVYLVYYK